MNKVTRLSKKLKEFFNEKADKISITTIDLLQKESCCFHDSIFQKKSNFKVHYRSNTYYPGHFLTL